MGALPMSTKVLLVISLVLTLSGCTAIFDMAKPREEPAPTAYVRLDARKSVFITIPGDGEFGDLRYVSSGRAVTQAVAAAFTKQGIPVHIAEGRLSYEEALSTATRFEAGYIVVPVITLWDPHNEWLGRSTALAVRVSLVDVATGRVIGSGPVEARNPTVISFTISNPETLLEKPLYEYVSKLY
jgi:hypothetical protein